MVRTASYRSGDRSTCDARRAPRWRTRRPPTRPGTFRRSNRDRWGTGQGRFLWTSPSDLRTYVRLCCYAGYAPVRREAGRGITPVQRRKRDAGGLVPIGQVGTGFSAVMRRRLRDLLALLGRSTSPLAASLAYAADPWIRWAEAKVVVDVDFREFTGGGLRHPSFKGVRADVPPRDVRRSSLQ
ncbi:hypothetical protein [Rhodococcus sp. ACS1]|uniref:ATP dependent DNA ligase n=1 Tax=Rhodococcus sp. ACS1 TaxID=2028570 RepID=UPI00359C4AAF